MLSVLAIDEEPASLAELTGLLKADDRVDRVIAAREAAAALRDLGRLAVAGDRLDAVFLDIRLPDVDGLDFARSLGGFAHPPTVVFVTAREEFAVSAFELGALDYLLKPVRPERLAEAVRRITEAAVRPSAGEPVEGNLDGPEGDDEMIPVELGGRVLLVPVSDVRYVEAHRDYVRLHTTDDGSYLLRVSLGSLAKRWAPAGFIRIHRSTLVAARHISELRLDEGRAFVQVGERRLPVSRRHTREVRDLLIRGFFRPDAAE
jgi:DNA-binding LytR/AlgR family response regulator